MKAHRILPGLFSSFWLTCLASAAPTDPLESGFLSPPDSAKPQTWWHWMNGNITKAGLTADLEAMKQIGLGGATIVNVDCGIPRGPVAFMSHEWREDFKFAVEEANRLGLQLCVENCAGWSSSGGPWNTVTNAMQRVTTSELEVTGPTDFSAALPQPPTKLEFYRDIAVLAFPAPDIRATIANLDAKAGFNGDAVLSSRDAVEAAAGAVQRQEVVDLTSKLTADGKLNWQVPAGKWTILRIGYTPTGVDNHPAPGEGEGLECDKFSKAALDAHWAGFMQKVLDDLGPLAGKTLDASLIDSYEVGGQNWTKSFREEFQKRRGYDLLKYLPAFTGRVVDNPAVSERFLWDVRRTIADLFAENYYGHFAELCREHGLMNAVEPYTGPFESLQCGAPADVVMGEFWSGSQGHPSVKMAASIAHIYGKTIVGAESFTASPEHGRWQNYPYSLKALGDLMYCQGLNRCVFHRYAMQPWTNRWPGMTMGQWGFHFERTETWWNQGKPWIAYLTHCQFLLQQGRAAADAAYFTGQSAPVEMRVSNPPLPAGYDYDAIDADVLLRGAIVKNGHITLASGANYSVLILPPEDVNMTPQMLQCLRELVRAGATVVGLRPQHSPSLAGYPECDARVQELADELWGKCDGTSVLENPDGDGRVVWGKSLADVFAAQNLKPDFEFTGGSDTRLAWVHRVAGAADIYFISNQRAQFDAAEGTFRVSGKTPELWHPDTGIIESAPVWSEHDGRTTVRLTFDPAGSVFVVFRAAVQPEHLASIRRAGRPIVEERPKPMDLRILKAVYGAFSSGGQGWLDVTATAKSLVAGGTRQIPASNDMAGDDPAPNIVKRLRVEYRLSGQPRKAEVQEGETLELPAGAMVEKALYGALPTQTARGSATTVDITGKLAALVKAGELNVRIDNDLAGGDPAWLVPKELHVDYCLNGAVKHAIVQENETLTLPETGLPAGTPSTFAFANGADGQMRLRAWAPGTFNFAWASGRKTESECSSVPAPLELARSWEVGFPPGWKAPSRVTFERLQSWPENSDPGIKYFSGTATYSKEFEVPDDLPGANREFWLDLGAVKNFAEVSLNGRPFGILWKPPFRVDISTALRPGRNKLEVKVTNLWPNRLIGDEQSPADVEWSGKQLKSWPQWLLDGKPSPTGRLTFTTWHHWTRDSPLLESGLLGPVMLRTALLIPVQ
ncbi:MAG: glycosyl hydrolase [Limisphaerales bacterium]